MRTIIVFDTNVLLSDPHALFAYPDAEIIVPQVVLAEIDKIKTARPDKQLRYKGREISRLLFELSDYGQLTEGIELDNNSVIRVAPYDPNSIPPTLSGKNADDRILGCAWQEAERHPDAKVILISNDLNVLLKAQTLGIAVQRHEVEDRQGRLAGLLSRLGRKRVTTMWLAIPLLIAVAFVGLWLFRVPSPIPVSSPVLSIDPDTWAVLEQQYSEALKRNPRDTTTWQKLGELYTNWGLYYRQQGQSVQATDRFERSADSYSHAIKISPRNVAARTNLATTYYYLGNVDQAISEYVQVLSIDPNHASAYFNLGMILWQHGDLPGAKRAFENFVRVAPNAAEAPQAQRAIKDIETALARAGGSGAR